MDVLARRALTAVARGQAHADLYLRGATLLNVYTGEVYPANVAARGERIAYAHADLYLRGATARRARTSIRVNYAAQ
jgi:adenine deaminase